jgi:pectate lyase
MNNLIDFLANPTHSNNKKRNNYLKLINFCSRYTWYSRKQTLYSTTTANYQRKTKMKQTNHQQPPTNTGETSSNNENNKKQTITIKEDTKKLLSHRAGAGERAECNAPEAASL